MTFTSIYFHVFVVKPFKNNGLLIINSVFLSALDGGRVVSCQAALCIVVSSKGALIFAQNRIEESLNLIIKISFINFRYVG